MCIVVDTSAFARVFDVENVEHDNFKPVNEWIIKGKGKLIIGGSKYKTELLRHSRNNIRLVSRLDKASKISYLKDEEVDGVMSNLEAQKTHRDFDDPHILAMCIVSRCLVVCTGDSRSHKFLKMKSLYPKNQPRPGIYSGKHNADLLTNDALLPCSRL